MIMKISKDEPLSILTRVFGYRGRYHLAATALLGCKLTPGGGLLPEEELWTLAADNLGRDEALDLGMPKPQGEALVSGWCFPPGGRPAEAVTAEFQIGKIEKRIVVVGDRYWLEKESSHHTSPRPFNMMPLSWERAFGGPDYGLNPVGRGLGGLKMKDGSTLYPLPNLEAPRHPVATSQDRPEPVGMGPMGMSWPGRLKGLGTFDQKWRLDHWPGLPEDFDFSYFNMAPKDQRWAGYFQGNESLSTVHLTADQPRLAASLPGVRVRIFIIRKNAPGRNWIETKANLDTVWLFPHAKSGVLVWHGSWETGDDEGEDIAELMAVIESLSAPERPAAEHELRLGEMEETPGSLPGLEPVPPPEATVAMKGRSPVAAPAAGGAAIAAAATPFLYAAPAAAAPGPSGKDLPPEPAKYAPLTDTPPSGVTDEEIVAFYEGRVLREQDRLNAHLQEIGIDPEAVPPADLPPELAKYAPLTDTPPSGVTDEEIVAFYEGQALREQNRLNAHLQEIGIDPEAFPTAKEPLAIPGVAEVTALLKAAPGNHDELIAALEEMELERQSLEKETAALLTQAGQDALQPAALSAAAGPEGGDAVGVDLPETGPEAMEKEIGRRLEAGQGLAGMDLAGVDLRPFLLAGADLSGANLEGANLAGNDLTGAVFSHALLAGAFLSGSSLAGVSMTGANASRAKLDGADLKGADLSGMDLTGADLQGADLTGADMRGTNLSEANLAQVRGAGVQAQGALFIGAEMTGADFTRAVFAAADLSEARLKGTVFTEADLSEVWFSDVDASAGDFRRANMKAAKGEGKTVFRNADFANADLSLSYFEDADFSAANLDGAELNGASLTRCLIRDANLTQARARNVDLSKSDLAGADMQGMNLVEGSLRKAFLAGADLRQANLFAADVFKCNMANARIDGANLKRTLLAIRSAKP